MRRISVPLNGEQREALISYSAEKYRDPRLQAALFIQRGLENVGALPANEGAGQESDQPTAGEGGDENRR